MSITKVVQLVLAALLMMFFQIYLMNHLILFNVAVPFIYILFLFMLPTTISTEIEFALGFLLGLIVDITSDTFGVNASAVLFALAAKRIMVRFYSPSSLRDSGEINLTNQNFVWYVIYLLTLIFVHHTVYFLLEAFSFQFFGHTLLKIVASTIYSFAINYIICITFYKK